MLIFSSADLIFRAKKVEAQNKEEKVDSAKLRLRISQAKTEEALEKLKKDIPEEDTDTYTLYSDKLNELKKAKTAQVKPAEPEQLP